jgi:hypothetical protein
MNPEKKQDLTFRRFAPERDLHELAQLYRRVFKKETTAEFLKWKYLPPWADEPFSRIALEDDRIFGHLGVVPLRGKVKGKDVPFFLVGDIMADPERRTMEVYRQLNVKGYFETLRKEHPHAVMYGFMGARLGRFYRWFMTSSIVPCVGHANDRIIRAPAESQSNADARRFDVCEWSWDAPELDQVWQQLKDTIVAGLVRDQPYLNWRYGTHPTLDYTLFGVRCEGKPVGWFVTGKRSLSQQSEDEVRIHDMLLAPEVRLPVLRYAATALHAKALVFWLPPNCLPADIESRESSWVVSHWPFSPDVSKEFLSNNVYYTLGEADQWWK